MMPSEVRPLALDAVEDAASSVLLGARAVVLRGFALDRARRNEYRAAEGRRSADDPGHTGRTL